MKLPAHWRSNLVWGLGGVGTLALLAAAVMYARGDGVSKRVRRARRVLLVAAIVAAASAAALEISPLAFTLYGKASVSRAARAGRYDPVHTVAVLG